MPLIIKSSKNRTQSWAGSVAEHGGHVPLIGVRRCKFKPCPVHQKNPLSDSFFSCSENGQEFSQPFFSAHHLRFATLIFLLAAADIVRLGLLALARPPVFFAHLAFCARLILLRAEAETVLRCSV
jgi:hypothetical protein